METLCASLLNRAKDIGAQLPAVCSLGGSSKSLRHCDRLVSLVRKLVYVWDEWRCCFYCSCCSCCSCIFFSLVVIGIGEARSVEGKKFTSVVLCKGPCARIILVAIDYWRRPESDTRLVGTVHGRFAAASDADFATMY